MFELKKKSECKTECQWYIDLRCDTDLSNLFATKLLRINNVAENRQTLSDRNLSFCAIPDTQIQLHQKKSFFSLGGIGLCVTDRICNRIPPMFVIASMATDQSWMQSTLVNEAEKWSPSHQRIMMIFLHLVARGSNEMQINWIFFFSWFNTRRLSIYSRQLNV